MMAGGLTIWGVPGAAEGKKPVVVDTVDMGENVRYTYTVALGLGRGIILRFRPGGCIETYL